MELWSAIEGYPAYLISNYGRVFSQRRDVFLKQKINRGGYLIVNLYNELGIRMFTVHGLVAKAFLEYLGPGLEVNHLDGNKSNNFSSNLEWVNSRANHRHAFEMGLRDPKFRPQAVRCIETGEVFSSMAEAGERTGTYPGNISSVIRGRMKQTNGYHFELV